MGPQLVGSVLAPLTLFSCLKDTSYADTMIKLTTIWCLANGILMTLSPQTGCEGYGIEVSSENKGSIRTLGFLCIGSGVFLALNAFTDMDPVQAFGECCSCRFIYIMNVGLSFLTLPSCGLYSLVYRICVDSCVDHAD